MKWRLEHVVAAIALPLMLTGIVLKANGNPIGQTVMVWGIGVMCLPLVGVLVLAVVQSMRH